MSSDFGKPIPKVLTIFGVLLFGTFFGTGLFIAFAYERAQLKTALLLAGLLLCFVLISRMLYSLSSCPKFQITDRHFIARDVRPAFGPKKYSLGQISDVRSLCFGRFLVFRNSGRRSVFYLPFRSNERKRLVSQLRDSAKKSPKADSVNGAS